MNKAGILSALLCLVMIVCAFGESVENVYETAEETTVFEVETVVEEAGEEAAAAGNETEEPVESVEEAETETVGSEILVSESELPGESADVSGSIDPELADMEFYQAGDEGSTVAEDEASDLSETEEVIEVTAELDRSSALIGIKDSGCVLSVIFSDDSIVNEDGTERTVVYRSSNTKYVRVDEEGRLTGIAKGSANVTAEVTYEGKTELLKCSVKVLTAPKSIKISPAKASLDLGRTDSVDCKISFSSGYGASYVFDSSDPEIAEVDDYGRVIAVRKGQTTITGTTFNGKHASSVITVWGPVNEIYPVEAEYYLGEGMQEQLQFNVPEFERDTYKWSSSDDDIVQVDDQGKITCAAPGEAVISVAAENGSGYAEYCIHVAAGPDRIEVPASTIKLGKGNRIDLFAEGIFVMEPAEAVTDFSYRSSKSSVAAVNGEGVVKAVKTGKSVIKVTTSNGKSAAVTVDVRNYPSSMKLSAASLKLGVGMTAGLSVSFGKGSYSRYIFSSSAPDVVSVDPDTGAVTAEGPGSAVITCACISGTRKATCKVEVYPAPDEISLENAEITGYVGKTGLSVKGIYPQDTKCLFEYCVVDGTEHAAVDPETGELTFLSAGTATVRVSASNNAEATAECTINILPAPEELLIDREKIVIGKGNTLNLLSEGIVSILPENSATDYSFSTSSKKYVSVSKAGVIKGENEGSATIRIRTHNGLEKSIKVQVLKYPSKITLSTTSLKLGVGMTRTISVKFKSKEGSLYKFTSSAPEIASVDADGIVTAVGEGTATITCACTTGKVKASCKVTVLPAPSDIHFEQQQYELRAGTEITVSAIINEGSKADLTYSIADESIATIDANGKVTGIAAGSTTISVTTHNGITNTEECVLTVHPLPDEIIPDEPAMQIAVGEIGQINFGVEPANAWSVYTYTSSRPSVLKVDASGRIHAMSAGSAVVTITAENGTKAEVSVEVLRYSDVYTDVMVIAHRGASGDYPPGNSLIAFSHAKELGADRIELDIQRSSDGVIFVRHDTTMKVNGKNTVLSGMKYSEIIKRDKNVCTLEEALLCIKEYGISVEIELKMTGIERQTINIVESCGMTDMVSYGSFNLKTLEKIKSIDPSCTTVYIISSESILKSVADNPGKYACDIVSPYYKILNATYVRSIHFGGKSVAAWTIDDVDKIQKMIELGVDGIITNYPQRVK